MTLLRRITGSLTIALLRGKGVDREVVLDPGCHFPRLAASPLRRHRSPVIPLAKMNLPDTARFVFRFSAFLAELLAPRRPHARAE